MARSPADQAAERVCARLDGRPHAQADLGAAMDRLLLDLRNGLSPWIGGDAYAALVRRSVQNVAESHPAAPELPWHDEVPQASDALARHGREAVTGACVATVRAMIDQLAVVVGSHMAIQLVEQSLPRKPSARAHPEEADDA
jgi:hypothetical protein